jgi:hypothetical protein
MNEESIKIGQNKYEMQLVVVVSRRHHANGIFIY